MRSPIRLWLVPLVTLIGAFLVLPALVVIPMSFTEGRILRFPPRGFSLDWYEVLFRSSEWRNSIVNSLRVAALTTTNATILGTLAAIGLVRIRNRLKSGANAILLAPMIVPYVISALAFFGVFLRWGIAGTTLGLVLAHTALAVPFVVINVVAVLSGFDTRLTQAALSMGASPWRAFWTVMLPVIRPGVIAGALFAFIVSFDEIVVAIFLTSPLLRTLPVQMWAGARVELQPTLAAASTMLILISLVVVLVAARFWMIPRTETQDE